MVSLRRWPAAGQELLVRAQRPQTVTLICSFQAELRPCLLVICTIEVQCLWLLKGAALHWILKMIS